MDPDRGFEALAWKSTDAGCAGLQANRTHSSDKTPEEGGRPLLAKEKSAWKLRYCGTVRLVKMSSGMKDDSSDPTCCS
jgi:hypothetical protein